MAERDLDCVVIGYNEVPFERYEGLLRAYGEDSEAYRDLKLSFVELEGQKLLYAPLMNHVTHLARSPGAQGPAPEVFLSGEIPNLAAAYLTHFLHRQGFRAAAVNLFQQQKDLLAELLDREPLCVAITTTFYVLNLPVIEMVEFIRRHNPRVKIVVGGPLIANHTRNYSGEALNSALLDLGADVYVVEAQGELTLARLLGCLAGGGSLESVPNLVYLDGDRLRWTAVEPESNPLDENVIDWRALAGSGDLGPTLQTRTARSCAFKCSFCNYPTRAGKLTLAGLEALERELDSMRDLGNVRNVVFIDDTFNVPLPRFKDLCRLMIRKGYGFDWFSYFRCSNSDEEAIDLMAESGCKGVFLGIESGSPSILKNMHKAAAAEQYRKGIAMLKQRGILTFGSFITGFPGETAGTVEETVEFIRSTGLDFYRTQLWYCEPGTPIVLEREKYGIEGEGFVWSHATMDSMEAMDWIEKIFLGVDGSAWLPQWSFDFWVIPYLLGKGIDIGDFRRFLEISRNLMALGVASVPAAEKARRQQALLADLVAVARNWAQAV